MFGVLSTSMLVKQRFQVSSMPSKYATALAVSNGMVSMILSSWKAYYWQWVVHSLNIFVTGLKIKLCKYKKWHTST